MKYEIELKRSYITIQTAFRTIEAESIDEAKQDAIYNISDLEWNKSKTLDYIIEIEAFRKL